MSRRAFLNQTAPLMAAQAGGLDRAKLAQSEKLIEDFVRNEIYYREAIAIGLGRDDEVLKRRLRQRMEFIYEDITSWAEPTDEDLKAFMKKHQEKYLNDPQLSFRQVYINTNRRGKSAEPDARQVLAQLTAGADPDSVGDPTMLEPEVRLSPIWDIRKQFGDEFSRNLLDLKHLVEQFRTLREAV